MYLLLSNLVTAVITSILVSHYERSKLLKENQRWEERSQRR